MARVRQTMNARGLQQIERDLNRVPVVAAEAFALELYTNLDSETHGRGEHYPELPNRSSTPEQMPVKQSGQLQSEVDYGPAGQYRAFAGLVPKTAERRRIARNLEYGNEDEALVQRAPVRRTGANRRTIEKMNAAVAKEFGGGRR